MKQSPIKMIKTMEITQEDLNKYYEHKSNKEKFIEAEEKALEEKEAEQDDSLEDSTSLEEIEKKIDNEKIEDLEEGDRSDKDYGGEPLSEEESEGDLKQP